jgi:hypothetical protein
MTKPLSIPAITGATGSKMSADIAAEGDNSKHIYSADDESKSENYEVISIVDSVTTPPAASVVPLSTFTSDVADSAPGVEDSKEAHETATALKSKLNNSNVKSDHIDPLKKVVGDNKAVVGGTTSSGSGAISKTGCCVCM